MRAPIPALMMTGLLASCGGPPEPLASSSFGLGTGPGAGPDSTGEVWAMSSTGAGSSTGPVSEASSTGSTGEGGTTGLLRDVGGGADLGSLHPAGCKGKIDFLFVISRYGLMEVMQEKLIAAFPEFIATIESKFAEFDYHIMVVDGDDTWGSKLCNQDCSPDGCPWQGYPCTSMNQVTVCDTTMGAGTVFPAGNQASNAQCEIAGDRRYLTREQPDLAATFACVAQIGLSGDAMLGEAVTAAVSPKLNGPGGCNQGFLRDDALLMVTFISDTPDIKSAGKPTVWAEAILAAKHGDPNSVVMFSIQKPDCNPWDTVCDLVKEFFPHWYIIDNLEPDYRPGFDVATDLVTQACSEFIPQ